jgi:uncharacterized protein (DUF2126 family)/transglutaminase-like putative cysteine protease
MTIRVAIDHRTRYRYDRPVRLSPQVLRLRPAPHCRTPIHGYTLRIRPEPHFVNWQQDPYGNYLARVVFPEPARALDLEVEVIAELAVINPFDFFLDDYAELYPFQYDVQLERELQPYLEVRERGALLARWLESVERSQQRTIDFLVHLNRRLAREVAYSIRMEPGVQSCDETLGKALGSCRDTGWLLVQILRQLGLAARFVSGYLVQLAPDQKSLDGPSGPERDFTDLHAWAEVYVPGAGWIGLDPTSGLFAAEGHIPLACTADPQSAAPVTGYTEKCQVEFSYSNRVTRIHEEPRVTRPYRDEQWSAIESLGRAIDAELRAQDVRLTMGGEPTFVSIDDMDAPEWTVAADGPMKRRLAADLIRRLREEFAPGGLIQHGQGKWYPGEALPRWTLGVYWRADRAALWNDATLLADPGRDCGQTLADAERCARALLERLGLDAGALLPGHEDLLRRALDEHDLPGSADRPRAGPDDPPERERLARLLAGGPGEPAGWVLPLAWDESRSAWITERWTPRRGHLVLLPGDSPMGLRLPLGSLPAPADGGGAVPVRTALCVELRHGCVHLFLPPIESPDPWCRLVAAIESVVAALGLPVVIEGYAPPRDPAIRRLPIGPDPGVLEVNIHPAASWDELVHNTVRLYELARESRLATEKFMLDGRHTGTGGGNHITIGGPTPEDSPVLRRPDLLRSLVAYWQNHPALSYLFSGLFIGPTSQAPRIDEARHEALYELEIAFSQVPRGEVPQPWLVDRLFRNLLVDVTGNTHRAEFCIDKLYAPQSDTGQLGLVELRAFEMTPHARMNLVQALLLRALIAWFWREPYQRPLVRWGTALHDRYMLPHHVHGDLAGVVADLVRAGYAFELAWFEPFFEFRYPRYGTLVHGDLALELRAATEPWHVLGEEATGSGTARYVDSSVERLQVRLSGAFGDRYAVACNGRRVPLRPTGTPGEYVAGVRYRAWQPPSALHPRIAVHAPLTFDLIDAWTGQRIDGCRYFVAHPGGRNYTSFPVNAAEAEARRHARFWPWGHTPLGVPFAGEPAAADAPPDAAGLPAEELNRDYPHTLDLRRPPGLNSIVA